MAQQQRIPWLFGPWPDLLFGCGLLYVLAFAAFLFVGADLRAVQPQLVFPLLTFTLGMPHYGATLLRVYEKRSERHAYAVFSLWATLAIVALFVAGLHAPRLASALVTLYLTWSPWHYTGQNYGLAVMFLRRAGVPLDALTKRWLYLSFVFSFGLVFVEMHVAAARMADLPDGYTGAHGAVFVPLGIPLAWAGLLAAGFGALYLAALAVTLVRLRRGGAWRALLPAGLLVTSQLLWFSLPYGIHLLGFAPGLDPLDWKFRNHYFTWIAAAHFLQYLWVTAYYAKQSDGWRGQTVQYGKALAAGAAPWVLPFVVFGPQAFGPLAADGGLGMLVATAVNLHHFVLDGAIWKLRGRIADVLIRSRPDHEPQSVPRRRLGLRHVAWAACALAVALHVVRLASDEAFRRDLAEGDLAGARAAATRLASLGWDRSTVRLGLGQALLREGRPTEAREQIERSLALAPTPEAQLELGRSYARERLWARAAAAYEAALAGGLPAEQEEAVVGYTASAWLAARQPERARPWLARLPPGDPRFAHLFEEAGSSASPNGPSSAAGASPRTPSAPR